MASYVSEDLNGKETVTEDSTRLTGYSFTSTGVEDSYVKFTGGDKPLIVVPAGSNVSLSALNEPFTDGMEIERRQGDGKLIASVFHTGGKQEEPSDEDEEPFALIGEADE